MSTIEQAYDTTRTEPGESGVVDPVLPRVTPELLAAYLATEVVDDDGVVWSGVRAVERLEACWVITAENPFSEPRRPEENAAANDHLAASIRAAGFATTPLVGRAADGSWSEACYAVRGASCGQVLAWGRAHGQHAVFRLSDDVHEVVSCWHAGTLASRARVLGRWGSSLIDTSPIRDIMSCRTEPIPDQSARMRALRFSISICALPWCTSTGGT